MCIFLCDNASFFLNLSQVTIVGLVILMQPNEEAQYWKDVDKLFEKDNEQ
jgi:hypothetical protein